MIRLSNSDLDEDWTNGRSQVKPSKSQLKPELRYYPVTFFELAEKFQMVFKELIYTLSKAVSSINVTEFSEGGRDSTKKDDLKGFKESAEVFGGISHGVYAFRVYYANNSPFQRCACS